MQLFKSVHHKVKCDACCCVQWPILRSWMLLATVMWPTEGRDGSISCYATSLSVTTCNMQCDVNIVLSA